MPLVFLGVGSHDALSGVSTSDHHVATVAGDLNLADLAERDHASITNVISTDHRGNASQPAMEDEGDSQVVCGPDDMKFNPGNIKTASHFTTVTTTTAFVNRNITSLTDNGTGDTTITFDTDFSGADNYAVAVSSSVIGTVVLQPPAIGSQQVITHSDLGVTPVDAADVGYLAMGDFV